jgi:RimJ/RimL family protein N-acetyltransferase
MTAITLHPWSDSDLPILQMTLGNPQMMEHLGGIETPEQIAKRHARFLRHEPPGDMFTIRIEDQAAPVGSIGFWERLGADGEPAYETGWMVLPQFAGRGIATQAALLIIERARAEGKHRYMHAYPSVNNAASNAVCRKAGFTNLGEGTWEYPKGHFMRCNDWRIDLSEAVAAAASNLHM